MTRRAHVRPAVSAPQVVCVRVQDADAHHAQAFAEGAEIVEPLEDKPYDGRGYSCRDPEGHVWNFGTYHPWQLT